jgi:outer membrane protein assembly factor BamE (lipoprotein component of BamABCDE complex)
MKKFEKLSKIILIIATCLAIPGCFKSTKLVGYTNEAANFDKLEVGKTRKAIVSRELGSPSSVSTYGPETWYYISTEQESVAFFKPKIKSQSIVAIEFADDQTIKSINKYSEADANDVKISSDVTPTEGHDTGVIGQMLGNVGRFNKDRRDATKPRTHP